MNFHLRYEKQITPQKSKDSETSPAIKRIRLVSPSPVEKTLTQSHNQLISSKSLDHQSDRVDNTMVPASCN